MAKVIEYTDNYMKKYSLAIQKTATGEVAATNYLGEAMLFVLGKSNKGI
jgi:hypothetical protein